MSRQAIYTRIHLWCAAANNDLTAFCDAVFALDALLDPWERQAIVREFNEVFA